MMSGQPLAHSKRKRGQHHSDIANGVVARAEPDGAYFCVAVPVFDQDQYAGKAAPRNMVLCKNVQQRLGLDVAACCRVAMGSE